MAGLSYVDALKDYEENLGEVEISAMYFKRIKDTFDDMNTIYKQVDPEKPMTQAYWMRLFFKRVEEIIYGD